MKEPTKVVENLVYEEQVVWILNYSIKQLCNTIIPLVKVLWAKIPSFEVTWEMRRIPRTNTQTNTHICFT